jgi:hypothetical protein
LAIRRDRPRWLAIAVTLIAGGLVLYYFGGSQVWFYLIAYLERHGCQ